MHCDCATDGLTRCGSHKCSNSLGSTILLPFGGTYVSSLNMRRRKFSASILQLDFIAHMFTGFGQSKVPTAEAVSWPYCKMDRDCTGWCGKAPAYCVNQVCQCFPPKTAQMWQLPNCNIPSDCPSGWCGRSGSYCVNHRCQCHPSKKIASEEQAIP